MKKRFLVLTGVGMVLELAALAFVSIPDEHHGKAAVAVIDKTNIEHAYNTWLEAIKIYETDWKQLQLLIANAQKIDLGKIAEFELNSELQRLKSDGAWRHLSTGSDGPLQGMSEAELLEFLKTHQKTQKTDGDLTGFIDTGVEWGRYLGDINAVLSGNISLSQAIKNEKRRADALNKTLKAVSEQAQTSQQIAGDILKSTEKELKALDDSNASMAQIQQHTAHIEANQTSAIINGFSAIGKAAQAEAAYYQAENVRRTEAQAIEELIRKQASDAADKITIGSNK